MLLAFGGAAQRWVSMRRWSAVLGVPSAAPPDWTVDQPHGPSASRASVETAVTYAVRRGSAHLPWEPTCLAQVVAGQGMLRRRGAPAVAVIGLRRAPDDWEAHAWLIGATRILSGGPAARGFTATTLFTVPGGLQPDDVGRSRTGDRPLP